MELTPIQCQSCGAQLNIDAEEDQVQCPFCEAVYVVKLSGSTVGLRQVTESLGRIDLSTSATARELRIARLREERRELETQLAEDRHELGPQLEKRQQLETVRSKRSKKIRWAAMSAVIAMASLCMTIWSPPDPEGGGIVFSRVSLVVFGIWSLVSVVQYYVLDRAVNKLDAPLLESEREIRARIEELEEGISMRSEAIDELIRGGER